MKLNPLTDNLPLSEQDRLRAIVGAENVAYHNGVMLISPPGLRILCKAVIDGGEPGDPEAARAMLEALEGI